MAMTPEQEKEYYHEQREHASGNELHDVYDKLAGEGVHAYDPRLGSVGERQDLVQAEGRRAGTQLAHNPQAAQAGMAPGPPQEPEWMRRDRGEAQSALGEIGKFGMAGPGGIGLAEQAGQMHHQNPLSQGATDLAATGGEMALGGAVAGKITGMLGAGVAQVLGKIAARLGPKAAAEAAETLTKDIGDLADHVRGAKTPAGATKGAEAGTVRPNNPRAFNQSQTGEKGVTSVSGKTPAGRDATAVKGVTRSGPVKTTVAEGKGMNVTAGKTPAGRDAVAKEDKTGGVGAKPGKPVKGAQKKAAGNRVAEAQAKWREANPGKKDPESWSKGKDATRAVEKAGKTPTTKSKTAAKAGDKKASTKTKAQATPAPTEKKPEAAPSAAPPSDKLSASRKKMAQSKELPDSVWSVANRMIKGGHMKEVSRGEAEHRWSTMSPKDREEFLGKLGEAARKHKDTPDASP